MGLRRGESRPWENTEDPALTYAYLKQLWYDKRRSRSKRIHQISELLILLATASTVAVAALQAPAPVTATAAAISLVLTGHRQVFRPNEARVEYTVAAVRLEQTIARYRLLPETERTRETRQELLDHVIEITSAETHAWAKRVRGQSAAEQAAIRAHD